MSAANSIKSPLRIVLLLSCPDQQGIVAHVSRFIYEERGNIVESMQHSAIDSRAFFMRVEWDWSPEGDEEMSASSVETYAAELSDRFSSVAEEYRMDYRIAVKAKPQRMAIMVSQHLHCLYDLLLQWREAGSTDYEIACVISNHRAGEEISEWLHVPFHYVEVCKGEKERAEEEQLRFLERYKIDLIVLARYMQILSGAFIARYTNRIINIHHSFLPAFVGAKLYHQAYARGVKIIGATSQYATEELDQGPIIAQDVERITHNDTIHDIIGKGKNLERNVLNKAVQLHLQRRVYVYGNKTIVFD